MEHGTCPTAEFTSPWLNCAHSNRIPYPLFCWCRDVHLLLKNIKWIPDKSTIRSISQALDSANLWSQFAHATLKFPRVIPIVGNRWSGRWTMAANGHKCSYVQLSGSISQRTVRHTVATIMSHPRPFTALTAEPRHDSITHDSAVYTVAQ